MKLYKITRSWMKLKRTYYIIASNQKTALELFYDSLYFGRTGSCTDETVDKIELVTNEPIVESKPQRGE